MSKIFNKIADININFAQWYTDVCYQAGLFDYGLVKGTIIFKPYGYAIWENIQRILDAKFKKLDIENVYLPLLIPASYFQKEQEHIKGFNPELATVTEVGNKLLKDKLYIRPTSEILMSYLFSNVAKTYRDLPIKYNQWCSVIRWEKTSRPFLRNSEFLWQEGHSLHQTPNQAFEFTNLILNLYSDFFNMDLSMFNLKLKKSEKERFAGAKSTFSIEVVMRDGKFLQSGTSHYFGDNFTKIFKVRYENKNQVLENGHTTSWGVSSRLIGALIMSHGDQNGLKLPFSIAPIQILICLFPKPSKEVIDYSCSIFKKLNNNYRCKLDDNNQSIGRKRTISEIKGIPFRIEIGNNEFNNKTVTIKRRDQNDKKEINLDQLNDYLAKEIDEYQKSLYQISKSNYSRVLNQFKDFNAYKSAIELKNILTTQFFCGEIVCENALQQKTLTCSRGFLINNNEVGNCFACGQKNSKLAYFGKSY